jgi:hypothetical protein
MSLDIVPTVLQQYMYHIYFVCLGIAYVVPLILVYLETTRKRFFAIITIVEIILAGTLIINLLFPVVVMSTLIMMYGWLLHLTAEGIMWFRYYNKRLLMNQTRQKHQNKLSDD